VDRRSRGEPDRGIRPRIAGPCAAPAAIVLGAPSALAGGKTTDVISGLPGRCACRPPRPRPGTARRHQASPMASLRATTVSAGLRPPGRPVARHVSASRHRKPRAKVTNRGRERVINLHCRNAPLRGQIEILPATGRNRKPEPVTSRYATPPTRNAKPRLYYLGGYQKRWTPAGGMYWPLKSEVQAQMVNGLYRPLR
jgi:hypothetical protein